MTIVLPTSNAFLATTLSAHFSLHKARVKVIQREIPEVHSHHNSVEGLPTPQPFASHKRATLKERLSPEHPCNPLGQVYPIREEKSEERRSWPNWNTTPRPTLSAPPDATQPDTTSLEVGTPNDYHIQAAPAGKNSHHLNQAHPT